MPEKLFNEVLTSDVDLRSFSDEDRTFTAFASKPVLDRHGTIIPTEAWDLRNYRQNPVLVWAHDYSKFPIGHAAWISKTKDGLKFKPQLTDSDVGNEVYRLYKNTDLRAFSVGFEPYDWIYPDDEEAEDRGFARVEGGLFTPEEKASMRASPEHLFSLLREIDRSTRGRQTEPWLIFTDVELLEVSCVPIPSCPTALVAAYQAGRVQTRELKEAIESQLRLTDGLVAYTVKTSSTSGNGEDHNDEEDMSLNDDDIIEGVEGELSEELSDEVAEEVLNRVGTRLTEMLTSLKAKEPVDDDIEDIPSPAIKKKLAEGDII